MVSDVSDTTERPIARSAEVARTTITKTTITPAPGQEPIVDSAPPRPSVAERLRRPSARELAEPLEPLAGANVLRLVMSTMLSALCLLTVGGAIMMLLLWQQERASGVLTSQLDRTWNLIDKLQEVERVVALLTVPVAAVWIAYAVVNVRRAAGHRRNPVVAAASLIVGVGMIWVIGDQIVAASDDWIGRLSGFVLQLVFVAVPLLALERVATAAEARRRPLRATALIAALYLALLQFLAALSTLDENAGPDEWGRLGAYLIIAALVQVLGVLAANEAARAIEEGTEHRYQLRHRFGESLLSQAERG